MHGGYYAGTPIIAKFLQRQSPQLSIN